MMNKNEIRDLGATWRANASKERGVIPSSSHLADDSAQTAILVEIAAQLAEHSELYKESVAIQREYLRTVVAALNERAQPAPAGEPPKACNHSWVRQGEVDRIVCDWCGVLKNSVTPVTYPAATPAAQERLLGGKP
jgi:hypothetical protein